MTEKRRRNGKSGISTTSALLGGVLLGVVLLYVVAYVGAVPGLTPSVTLQLGFQDLSAKMDDVLDELDSLSQALAAHEASVQSVLSQMESSLVNLEGIQSQISALATDISTLTGQLTTLTGDLADIQSALEDALTALEGIPAQLSALSAHVSSLSTAVADLQTEVQAIEDKLDPGGAFYSFVDNWFTTIQTAIANAQSAVVAEINANEVKIDDIEAKLDVGGAFYGFVGTWFVDILEAISNARSAIIVEIDENQFDIGMLARRVMVIKNVADISASIGGGSTQFYIRVGCDEDFQVKAVYARASAGADPAGFDIQYWRVDVYGDFVDIGVWLWNIRYVVLDPAAGGASSNAGWELLSQMQIDHPVGIPGEGYLQIYGLVQTSISPGDDTMSARAVVETEQSALCYLDVVDV